MGQEVAESGLQFFTLQIAKQDGQVGIPEFGQYLETEAAGWGRGAGVRDHCNAFDPGLAG